MQEIEQSTADLIAANAVQNALAAHPDAVHESVPTTILALHARGAIDDSISHYVLTNRDRFELVPEAGSFEVAWGARKREPQSAASGW